jgi:hypothetical protein
MNNTYREYAHYRKRRLAISWEDRQEQGPPNSNVDLLKG